MTQRVMVFLMFSWFIITGVQPDVYAQEGDFETLTVCVPAKAAAETGQVNLTLESDGQQRSYVRYIPASYNPNVAASLVLNLHGFAGWASQQAEMSGWNAVADEGGFIVVYPQGTGRPLRWNTGAPFSTDAEVSVDVAYIADLLDALEAELCIDPARIYVSGMSNGGGMSNTLVCQLSDRIAAMGSVAGAQNAYDQPCETTRPVPVIAFHGTDDTIVPYNGQINNNFTFPPIMDWVDGWAERNGCEDTPATITGDDEAVYPVGGAATAVQYLSCDDEAEVVFYTIDGGGHTWPGSPIELLPMMLGETNSDINASAIMWEFFRRHPMRITADD